MSTIQNSNARVLEYYNSLLSVCLLLFLICCISKLMHSVDTLYILANALIKVFYVWI